MRQFIIMDPFSSQSIAIARALKKDNQNILLGGIIESNRGKKIQLYDEYININKHNLTNYSNDYIIVPTTARAIKLFFDIFDECKLGNITLTKASLVVGDKEQMNKFTNKLGIPLPDTVYEVDEIKNYPVFYKQKFEKGGGERGVARSKNDLEDLDIKNLIFQEYIEGDSTFGVSFIANSGELSEFFIHEESLSLPKVGGSAVIIKKYHDNKLIEYTKRLIKELNYSGWGLAEYKYSVEKDEYYFMEINAKFWASCEFAFENGHFIGELFCLKNVDHTYPEGVVYLDRYLRSQMLDIVTNYKSCIKYKRIKNSSLLKSFIKGRINSDS